MNVLSSILSTTLLLLPVASYGSEQLAALTSGYAAAQYLKFETVLDGRCSILSDGGKLVLLHSTHPSKRIDYRLTRVFATKAQGFSIGTLLPNQAPSKLGCDKVGGRAQSWQVNRARFIEE